ncbi:MAG: AsmA family protein [Rhodospirillales bacterium]|nr:AsmA family protein [Rhodospirillales bacterium]MBO6786084.1 AsmA family protein [Rhodospirillales bacterium]
MLGFLARTFKFALKAAVVIAGIAVVISYARLSEFGDMRKALIDKIMNSYAGRIAIDGEIDLNLAFPPSVSIEGVRIKNAKWGTRPDMLTAQRVVAEVDLIPLLQGDMAVPRLRMIGVDIVVETRKDGTTNWDELNEFDTAAGPGGPAAPMILPQVGGTAVSVAGGTLTIVNAALPAPTVLSLSGGSIESGILIPCL